MRFYFVADQKESRREQEESAGAWRYPPRRGQRFGSPAKTWLRARHSLHDQSYSGFRGTRVLYNQVSRLYTTLHHHLQHPAPETSAKTPNHSSTGRPTNEKKSIPPSHSSITEQGGDSRCRRDSSIASGTGDCLTGFKVARKEPGRAHARSFLSRRPSLLLDNEPPPPP